MSNVNELAVQAKTDPAILLPLWEAVQRLVCMWANKCAQHTHAQGTRLYDTDDLIQAGYLAIVDAVKGYDTEAGKTFAGYLRFHIRKRFAEVSGHRGSKHRPEADAASLDTPLGEDNAATLADLMPDPDAEFAEGIIEREAARQDCAAIMPVIDALPDNLRNALMLTGWDGLSFNEAAEVMGVKPEAARRYCSSAKAKVRKSKTGQRIMQERYSVRRVGLTQFRYTHTSEVEKHILWLEERGLLALD